MVFILIFSIGKILKRDNFFVVVDDEVSSFGFYFYSHGFNEIEFLILWVVFYVIGFVLLRQ